MAIEGIKHIIFDFGGVLLNIDYQRTEDAFVALGLQDFKSMYAQAAQTDFFSDYETGRIDTQTFISGLKQYLPPGTPDTAIVDAWNAMLLEWPIARLRLLQQLHLHYDLALLSNTNELHEKVFKKTLKVCCGYENIGVFFDKVFFSHRIGMRKPDKETFQFVLDHCGFAAADTLFIDDSFQHIEGARSLGIHTIWLQPGMTIEDNIFLPRSSKV